MLRADHTVTCFGDGARGEMGSGLVGRSQPPSKVLLSDVAEIDSNSSHTCARLLSGAVACWGPNGEGQLVAMDGEESCKPAGLRAGCAQQLGDGTVAQRQKPVMVKGLDDAVELAMGFHHSCARRASGEVWCWGYDGYGELGDGPRAPQGVRTEIPGLADRRCGDGALFTGEECDDQNSTPDDGCSDLCQVEAGWKCTDEPSWCRPPVRGEDCLDPIPLKAPASYAGSLEGLVNDTDPNHRDCTKTWATGGDAVFATTVPAGRSVEVTATSDADLVLYASTDCAELLANCFAVSDAAQGGNPESLVLDNLEGTRPLDVFVVVDSFVEATAPYALELTLK